MKRFTSNIPRPLVSVKPVIKPVIKRLKVPSPVAIYPVHSPQTIPSTIMPPAEVPPPESAQPCSNSEATQNLEQSEEETISTSEPQLTSPNLPESSESSQCIEPPSPSPEPVQSQEEHEGQTQGESTPPGKTYSSRPRMRMPPPVD